MADFSTLIMMDVVVLRPMQIFSLPQLIAMATLNLASKVQEHNTKLGDVVNTCHRYDIHRVQERAPTEH